MLSKNSNGDDQTFGPFPGGQGIRNFSFETDPLNPLVVYLGGDRQPAVPSSSGTSDWVARIFRANFGHRIGQQWEILVGNGANGSAPHADSRDIAFTASNHLYEANDVTTEGV